MQNVSTPEPTEIQTNSRIGEDVAIILILLWFSSLIGLMAIDISSAPLLWIVAAVCLRSFLHTGLFITTHEAIHGVVSPNRKFNDLIGYISSFLYALLPYKLLAKNHMLHHRYPASEKDPDYHESEQNNFLLWYGKFMKEYLQGRQAWILLVGMAVIFGIFLVLHIRLSNIFLFWVIPILISSLQLFTFGIFLPHRKTSSGKRDRHQAISSNYSVFWSFIACYHFDYHCEHHQYPNLPWYSLPVARHELFCYQTAKAVVKIDSDRSPTNTLTNN
ncbi:fatty acid desaturase [Myxosarcina sp. GI1(2024)]